MSRPGTEGSTAPIDQFMPVDAALGVTPYEKGSEQE